jgi:hypothetical protein
MESYLDTIELEYPPARQNLCLVNGGPRGLCWQKFVVKEMQEGLVAIQFIKRGSM